MRDILQRIVDGRTDLVFELADKYAEDLPAVVVGGSPLLAWCAYYGDVSAIRFLLSKGSSLEQLGANHDLNGAAFHGHWQLCQFLLEQGANPNQTWDETGETPLHAVLSKKGSQSRFYIVKLLLSFGANVEARTKPGKETGAFMRDVLTKGETPLHRAAAFADVETIKLLLDSGAEKNAKDMNGDSPLAWASIHQRPDYILEMLCYNEFKINQSRVNGSVSNRMNDWSSSMDFFLTGRVHIE